MKYKFNKTYATPFFSIEEGFEDGVDYNIPTNIPYYRLNTPDSVICCVLNRSCEFILVNQFRPNLGVNTLELPAGSISKGESPIDAAHREFEEETGMSCNFLLLGDFHLMTNRINSKEHVFFGFDPFLDSNKLPEEGVKVVRVPRKELIKSALEGDYKQIAGLGVIQAASGKLGIDILSANIEDISIRFFDKLKK